MNDSKDDEVCQAAKSLIVEYEGMRLKVYDDGAGFPTVGIGHKVRPEDNLKIGDEITQEQCETLFEKDIAHAAAIVDELVTVNLTDNQFGALTSFVFNLGRNSFERSTLLKLVNSGDDKAAAGQFDRWIFAGAEIMNGLIARRQAESALFLTPDDD